MKPASRWLPAAVALASLACSSGGPGAPGAGGTRPLAHPKHDALLGPARGTVLLLGTYELPPAASADEASRLQIDTIVDKLIEFRPTKVALGEPLARQAELDKRYAGFLKGKVKADPRSLDRIALRVAQAMGHTRVWAVDADAAPAATIDLQAWAVAHDRADRLQSDIVARYHRWFEVERKLQTTESIEDNLVWLNDARRLATAHGRNLVGEFDLNDGDEYPGPDALTSWYNRHLRIFANLQRVATRDDERVLVVLDAAHVALLRENVEASPRFDLVEVNELLGVPQGAERQVVPLL